jgi:putative heme-binding domain-containing protein
LRNAAVQTMLRIPARHWPSEDARRVVGSLVQLAETTPPARRTANNFLTAMHLADELLPLLPVKEARAYRDRLRRVVVRVIQISTVQEEMRYDTSYFAVEAGRPVQLILRNVDLMPHNLLITQPGKLREVAQQAADMSPQMDPQGRQYVPKSPEVLFAMRTVDAHQQEILTFTAPRTPGEYPYVCTFPNHWMRMYGVMVVVKDLDAYQAAPTPPADPLGITRKIVKNWTMEDFPDDLVGALASRSAKNGHMIFQEATCIQCHKVKDEGGAVGPDLTEVFTRWKGDHRSVLRELIDPSHTIDPKFAQYTVATVKGKVISGIITQQDGGSITLVTNPDKPRPETIRRDDIEEMVKSSTSMMPKGLLDRFTREEIFDLLLFLKSHGATSPTP